MLELVSVLLLTLVVSVFVIWMYRSLLSWHRYAQSQVDTPRSASWMKLATQQGFMSFLLAPKERVKARKLSKSKDGINAPWGW